MSSPHQHASPASASAPINRRLPWLIVALAFVTVVIDGLDAAMMSASIPALAAQAGISDSAFTLPLVLTNVGIVLGYFTASYLVRRLGHKRMLLLATVASGVFTLSGGLFIELAAMPALTASRLITGIAIGWILPVANAIAADHAPEHRREQVSLMVTLGLPLGYILVGLIARPLLTGIGPSGLFWAVGPAALVIAALIAAAVPATPPVPAAARSAKSEASLARLFEGGRALNTLVLWLFAFLIFLAAYTITGWLPTFLVSYGMDPAAAPISISLWSMGGLVGGLLLIPLAPRFGVTGSLVVACLIGTVAIIVIATGGLPVGLVLFVLLSLGGIGTNAPQIGQVSMAVSMYPKQYATMAVGAVAGAGRLGSILGPAVGGILIAQHFAPGTILLMCAVPVAVSAGCAGLIAWRGRAGGRARARTTVVAAAAPDAALEPRPESLPDPV